MYRRANPFTGNYTALQFVEKDASKIVLFIGNILARPNCAYRTIRLRGLDPEARYRDDIGDIYTGAFLMNAGLLEKPTNDFATRLVTFEKV